MIQRWILKKTHHFRKILYQKFMKRPDKLYFQEPIELKDLVDTKNIIQ